MKETIKKILIPTDYSANAYRAANFGLNLAKKMNAEVILFHAYHYPMATAEDMVFIEKMKDGEVSKLQAEVETYQHKYPGVSIKSIVEFGSVVDLVESIVLEEKVDLVIMGTKGETGALDVVFGSVASNIINVVKCSMLIIPEAAHEFKLEEVILATEFRKHKSAEVYAPLLELLDIFGASVAIVNVQKEVDFNEVPSKGEIETDDIFKDYKHSHHFVEASNVEEALFDFSKSHSADMIVTMTRHYNIWEQIWHKSLSKKLALHSSKPLFIIHEDA
ncbi:universal stress protein [Paracrocinitomix mangrovi]|uniref:universal stress protein n=1 Tax=Paracrocinitomix mangrovi TaxID=2862509 RepID=UPI001C8EF618|nr:universal stress protein [Paracrocinitomix mangrovi]UKN01493.1 universal stress protein [Paracrocinitomix mangrovi]